MKFVYIVLIYHSLNLHVPVGLVLPLSTLSLQRHPIDQNRTNHILNLDTLMHEVVTESTQQVCCLLCKLQKNWIDVFVRYAKIALSEGVQSSVHSFPSKVYLSVAFGPVMIAFLRLAVAWLLVALGSAFQSFSGNIWFKSFICLLVPDRFHPLSSFCSE